MVSVKKTLLTSSWRPAGQLPIQDVILLFQPITGRSNTHSISSKPKIDHTYKLYYGGAQKRPDATYVNIIKTVEGKPFAEVPEASRKDVRNAVECAIKAQPGLSKVDHSRRSYDNHFIHFFVRMGEEIWF